MTGRPFVLGATGFVGREVIRQLCVRGANPVAHVRPDSKQLADWRARFGALGAEVDTTPWDAAQLAARIRALGVTAIYILIGTTRKRGAEGRNSDKTDAVTGDIYEAVDLGLTRIAVEAAVASGQQPRVIYLSSLGAKPDASSAYLAARGKAETVVRDAGLAWIIARPAIITGDRDDSRLGEHVGAVVGDGLLAVAGLFGGKGVRAKYRSTTPEVLASALIRLGEAPEANRVVDGADLR